MPQGGEEADKRLHVLVVAEASACEDGDPRLHRAGDVGDAAYDGQVPGDGGTPYIPADLGLGWSSNETRELKT